MDVERLRRGADAAAPAEELLERLQERGLALLVVGGESRDRVHCRVADRRRRGRSGAGTCRRRAPRTSDDGGVALEHGRTRAAPGGPPRSRPRRSLAPAQALESPIATGSPSCACTRRTRPTSASAPAGGTRRSARSESSRRSKSEPGASAASARSSASWAGSAASTTCGASRSQPSRAARPSRSPSARPPASSSKKSLIRFFSVSRSISWIFFIPTAVWLATARARSTSAVPSATRRPSSSSPATSGATTRVARLRRASSGPSSARPMEARASALGRRGRAPQQLLARRVEQVHVAGGRPEELRGALGDHRQELLERLRARDRLGELRQLLELPDARAHLLVEARVLDRAGDERGARDEEVDLGLRELARRLGVGGDDPDRVAAAGEDRAPRGATGSAPPRARARTSCAGRRARSRG